MDLFDKPFLNNVSNNDILKLMQTNVGKTLLKYADGPNNEYTRMQIHCEVADMLNDIEMRHGINDFTIQCDDRNNTNNDVNVKRLVVDLNVTAKDGSHFSWISLAIDDNDHSYDHHMDNDTLHKRAFARAMEGV